MRNSLGLNYKSAALPAELCRHFPRKILPDAPSASRFLYAFSIRLSLTLLKASFLIRSERTRGYSHRFSASAIGERLRLGAVTVFVSAMIDGS